MRNSTAPAEFRPNGWPFGLQSRCRLGTFEPAKNLESGEVWALGNPCETAEPLQSRSRLGTFEAAESMEVSALGNPCETAEPQQDSGPMGGRLVCRADVVWAPLNPLKPGEWRGIGAGQPMRNSAAPARFRPNGCYVGHLCQAGESWEAALRRWAQCLPCQESKRHLGNFLSVYRIRPPAEAQENSDDSDVDEALELSLDDLPTALQTLEPNQPDKNQQSQAVISATGFQLVDSMWPQQPLNVPAFEPATGYEDIDIPKLKKAMRTICPPQANCTSGASYAETRPIDATAEMAMPTPTPETVEAWAAQLPSSACNPEQKKFCGKVAERVAAELRAELRSDDAISKDDDPLRWVLHGSRSGHGQVVYR